MGNCKIPCQFLAIYSVLGLVYVPVLALADVHKMSGHRRSGCHHRTHQMSPTAFTLASFEVAIRRTGAALSRRQDIGVHADTHAATGIAPLETSVAEYFIQPFFLGLCFNHA